ncbi:histidine kinase [Roseateles sp.]|uniref:sensor histidine kinase n=1 Tax=Roseateles sp. TaxID=1971397 RepID=UPI003267F97F
MASEPINKGPRRFPDWLRWLFYPGSQRVFTAQEMARAGERPWPYGIDHYVYGNAVFLMAIFTHEMPRGMRPVIWSGVLLTAWAALATAHALWRSPTRKRLNLACYAAAVLIALVTLPLIKTGWRDEVVSGTPLLLAVLTAVLSAWWILTIYRVDQIEARLRELAEQDAALRLSTRLAAAQIQPHFLFNTLASLQHWVDTGDARAAPLLRDFTGYLRATLPMFDRELQPVADEMEMVRRYLAIMQARLGARLNFSIDVPTDVDMQLPPGIVLTLVENAIAHGIEPQLSGGHIAIAGRRDGDRFVLTVRDDGPGPAPDSTDGVGLANTRRRLAQACPDCTLTLADAAPGCIATLTL